MSTPSPLAQDFAPVSPSPANAFSDTEPSEEEKRQIKERINQNLQKLYQDAEELFKRRMQNARSDEERARLEGDLKLETGRIRSLGAEEYHHQLELERQQRKWVMGEPIDDQWKQILLREQNKILESFKPSGPNPTPALATNGIQHNENGRTNLGIRPPPIQESPPSIRSEVSQRKSSRPREERPGPRVRRESDSMQNATKEEHRHAAIVDPFIEPWTTRHNGDEPEPPLYNSASRSRASSVVNLDRSEEDRTASRLSDRAARPVASSPVKHEIWRPGAAEEETSGGTSSGKRNLTRRGSSASQRSIGSTSIRSFTAEPIPERPDVNEHEATVRRPEGEPKRPSLDKGKDRSRTFQLAAEPHEQEQEPPSSSTLIARVPNTAPSGRFSDRPHNYGAPLRANSVKLPKLDDDDRIFPYKSPRRHASKSSFTSDSLESRLGPAIEEREGPREWDFGFRGTGLVNNAQRPIVPKHSLNDLHQDVGRYGPDLFTGRRSRMDEMSNRDYRDRDEENWTASLRARGPRPYMSTNSFVTDDSYINYNRHSPESTRPPLSRGPSFNRSATDDYDANLSHEGYHRPNNQPPPSNSIPINRSKRPSIDDYGGPNWHPWGKVDGRPLAEGHSPYDYYTSPSSWSADQKSLSASYQARHHDFGGRDSNDLLGIENSIQEPDEENYKQRLLELERVGKEEAAKREEAERRIQEVVKKQKEDERKLKAKMEEVRRKEEEARKKEEEARRTVEEAMQKAEEAWRKREEAQKLEEEARRKEEEARRLEEEAKRREEEARRKEEEARLKSEEARSKEEEAARKEDEARRKEDEAKKKELEARKKEREAHKKELEAKRKESEARRKEFEAKRLEEGARRMEEDARRREEETEKREEEVERREEEALQLEEEMRLKAEDIRRREEELKKREEEFERREAESRLEDERHQQARLQEEEMRRQQEEEDERLRQEEEERLRQEEEECQRQEEEEKRRLVEAQLRVEAETIKRKEAETAMRREGKKEQDRKKREGERRRKEDERRQRLEEERRQIEEERHRLDEEIRQRELEEAARREVAERKLQEEERRRQTRLEEEERKRKERHEEERRRQEEERRQRELEELRMQELEAMRLQEEEMRMQELEAMRLQEEEIHRQELEELQRQELEEFHRQEMEERREAARRNQEEERRKQEEELRREQERIHEEIMRRQWEKQRLANDPAHTILQGAYERQREEIQKRKGEERKQSVDTSFVSTSPTAPTTSPLSSGRASTGPQRQGSMSGSAWTPSSGFAWKTATSAASTSPTTPSSSTTTSARSSTTSATSATSASSTNSNSRPKPSTSTPPLTESEWARRQAEQAKEQQERFRLEQEKKENQRLAEEANKQLTGKDLVQLYQHHEARWKDLNTFDVLRWDTFPWPMLRRPKTVEDIMESTIYQYLFTKFYPDNNKSEKDRVKEHIKRWHPDKFNTKYLPKVIEDDKERVKEGAGAVVRGLNAILTKMNEPSKLFG